MFLETNPTSVSQPRGLGLMSTETLDRTFFTPSIEPSSDQSATPLISKVEATISPAPVTIPLPVVPVTMPASISVPVLHPFSPSQQQILKPASINFPFTSELKSSVEEKPETVHDPMLSARAVNLVAEKPVPLLKGDSLGTLPSDKALEGTYELPGAGAVDVEAQADKKQEVTVTGAKPTIVVPPSGVNYSKWVYPSLVVPSSLSTKSTNFGDLRGPHVWAALPFGEIGPKAIDMVPLPLRPEYILFGGAQYNCLTFNPCGSRAGKCVSRQKTHSKCKHLEFTTEVKRIEFMKNQLKVAQCYLPLRGAEGKGSVEREQASSSLVHKDNQDVLVKKNETNFTSVDVEKGTIWTLACVGTASQLQDHITKLHVEGSKLDAFGFVTLSRHQWGLKRDKGGYVLGLGMKATPLQFAAASGRLDNVIVLISNGAADHFVPRLRDILSNQIYRLLADLLRMEKKKRSTKL